MEQVFCVHLSHNRTKPVREHLRPFQSVNLTITEHMGKAYAEWKAEEQTVREPDELDEAYRVIESLSPEQEEIITKYCDRIFSSGAETEEFFYRLGLKDGLKLKKWMKQILKELF